MPQPLHVAVSSQLPSPASPGGLLYFPPDPRPDSSTPVPLTPALSRQGRGGHNLQVSGNHTYEDIPVIVNPAVERNIDYFQNVIHDRFQEWLTRFYPYRPLIEQIFVEFGLPRELVYLSLVESGFNPRAYSRARASGPWQFIRSTGRMYGLTVNWYVDERRDPIKSTVAAAGHLRDLYDLFGSWPLALAAYNAGAGKISRAIEKTGTRDFWTIARTRHIRRETRQYVPKFMAAMIIATRPALFGFHAHFQPVHQYEEIRMERPVHLRAVAGETGVSFEELRRLNPELRRSVIPPDKDGYFFKGPRGNGKAGGGGQIPNEDVDATPTASTDVVSRAPGRQPVGDCASLRDQRQAIEEPQRSLGDFNQGRPAVARQQGRDGGRGGDVVSRAARRQPLEYCQTISGLGTGPEDIE